jgi:hypothetical protein
MSKHSPGPWIINDGTDYPENMGRCILSDAGTDREWTAVGIADKDGYAESVAYCHPDNAPLVSAAPEMLDALRLAHKALSARKGYAQSTTATRVRAAIAKAEGKS